MKSRDVASLAFKIMGIFVLLAVVGPVLMGIIYFICMSNNLEISLPIVLYVIKGVVIPLGIGLALILANDKIAKLIYRNNDDIEVSCTVREIYAIALACIGIWLICSALDNLINNIISSYYTFAESQRILWGALIGNVIRAVIGTILFLQRRGLATLWEKLNKIRNPVHKD